MKTLIPEDLLPLLQLVSWLLYGAHRNTFDPSTIQWVEILARHVSTILSLATVRKETAARIFHLTHHDSLTDLPNRIPFADRLKRGLCWKRAVIQGVDKKPRLLKKNINQPASNVLDLFLRRFFSSGHICILKMILPNIDKPFRHS